MSNGGVNEFIFNCAFKQWLITRWKIPNGMEQNNVFSLDTAVVVPNTEFIVKSLWSRCTLPFTLEVWSHRTADHSFVAWSHELNTCLVHLIFARRHRLNVYVRCAHARRQQKTFLLTENRSLFCHEISVAVYFFAFTSEFNSIKFALQQGLLCRKIGVQRGIYSNDNN